MPDQTRNLPTLHRPLEVDVGYERRILDHATFNHRHARGRATLVVRDSGRKENPWLQLQGQLFDHFVGAGEERGRKLKAESLRGLEVDDQLEFSRLLDW